MGFLININDKEFFKKLNNENVRPIADEIRRFLVDNVIKSGGHLASNLGVVELTLAMYKVFDFPKDKIVFDVGHQSYVHKILSGRADNFSTLRKHDGLSGFPKRSESPYDSFNTGHSSTSLSAALGIAKARDLNGDDYNVIAFIGDGALGGGMAFEALNDSGAGETKLIIVLNDNEMSINKNVGGLSSHLSMLRLSKKYINVKDKVNRFFNKFGKPGQTISKFVKKMKRAIKFATINTPVFEELGLTYIGLIDGHNIDDLTVAFEKAKSTDGPVLIHVVTKKGCGYEPAERNPDIYHGIPPHFNPENVNNNITYTSVFGDYITRKAESNKKISVITAAMTSGCGLNLFASKFPDRFFDVGIAEEHAVTLAAGLACENIIPVFSVYSTFLQRGYDQILHDVCIQNLHVVFSIDRAGVVGEDGETHQGLFDLSYLTHIPNMTVLAPATQKEFEQMMDYAIDKCEGPVAVRFPKAKINNTNNSDFEISKIETINSTGNNVVIFSVGRMLDLANEVFEKLNAENISSTLCNVRTIKPVNTDELNNYLSKCTLAVTIEDNVISGGAGQYLCNTANREHRSKFIHFGFPDSFVEHGSQIELMKKYGLSAENIISNIKKELMN
ncbi:MAG: 1-deoxy-D-xylulose-5-phosphate synthase [Clostridia bacterium]|nr:1-deoxy-D-xylulose-5-phosphate synthase [Clostridia bacterium]